MSDSGAQANGQSATNPFLEAMYKVHPEWRPKAENPEQNPVRGGANPAQSGGAKQMSDEERRARAIAALKTAQNGGAQVRAQTAPRGTISPLAKPPVPPAPTSPVSQNTRKPIGDDINEAASDAERAEAMKQLGIGETQTLYMPSIIGGTYSTAPRALTDAEKRSVQEQVVKNRMNKVKRNDAKGARQMSNTHRTSDRAEPDLLNLPDDELVSSKPRGDELRGKELLDALAENTAVGRQQREAIQRSRRDAERRSGKESELDERITGLFRAQRERREAKEADAASRRDSKARAEREARLESFVKKNAQDLLDVASTGDTDAVRRYMMAQNEKWSDADVEETTRILEELSM